MPGIKEPIVTLDDPPVEYDRNGKMKYHPEYHRRHGTRFTVGEYIYLCKFWGKDKILDIALALERTEQGVYNAVRSLQERGLFERYRDYEGDYAEGWSDEKN